MLLSIKLRCSHCNREKLPFEIACGNEQRGRICWNCLNNHRQNLDDIARNRPRRCNECRVSFDEMAARDENAVMVVVVKDGILQLLCRPCKKIFEPKSHQFKGTAYAHMNKIHAGVK